MQRIILLGFPWASILTQEIRLQQNIIDSNGGSGLTLFENAAATITNNTIEGNADLGISVATGSTAAITANTIEGNADDGVQIFDNSTATITHNTIRANQSLGIRVTTGSTAEITANTIEGNADDGIVIVANSTATITHNTVQRNADLGIRVATASTAAITANTIEGNADDGVQIFANSTATITHNTISENSSVGILVADASTTELVANIITANGNSGIALRGSVARISGGVLSHNRGSGVFLAQASTATIGLDGAILTLAQNGSRGIFVTNDGSVARINSARIMFDRNAGGNTIGPVLDFPDADLDGLRDAEEAALGTHPNHPDTDGDTFSDGVEVVSASDPLASGSTPTMILYGVTHTGSAGLSTFYGLDPMTGRAIRVGAMGFQRVSGMDVRADGTVYATGVSLATGRHVLLTVDPETGAGMEIGPTGVEVLEFQTVTDLAFRNADNTLYAYFGPGDSVGTLDPATGTATVLGPSGVFCCGNGIAFSPTDILFHANNEALHTLEQSHGTATVVAPLHFPPPADNRPRINAMDFQPDTGEVFAVLEDGSARAFETYLATINPITGEVTIIGRTVDGLDALAWFPVP